MMRKLNQKIRKLLGFGQLPGCNREGFTLIEIMMVMMILAVGVLPIAVIQHRARGQVSEADRHTQAIVVAQMHLERLKGQGFGNIAAENGQFGQITWASTVTNVAFGLDRVAVTATWMNDGQQETLTLADLVSTR